MTTTFNYQGIDYKVTINNSKRVITIKGNGTTYRTSELTADEMEYYTACPTANDWMTLIRSSAYVVR